MDNIIDLNPGDVRVARPPTRLRTSALGSCVAVVLYDNVERIGGMAHVMLPTTDNYLRGVDLLKYADEAIPYLVKQMEKISDLRYKISDLNHKSYIENHKLHARLVGGAMIVEDEIDIGSQVMQSCRDILYKHGIEIVAKRVGGRDNRSASNSHFEDSMAP